MKSIPARQFSVKGRTYRPFTWEDGSTSNRYEISRSGGVESLEIHYVNENNVGHRMDGGPSTIHMFDDVPVLIAWVVNGRFSSSRNMAGLPTLWTSSRFEWNVESVGRHSLSGPALLDRLGNMEFHINGSKVSESHFRKAYFITHFKELEFDQNLYQTLYDEMMTWVDKEVKHGC